MPSTVPIADSGGSKPIPRAISEPASSSFPPERGGLPAVTRTSSWTMNAAGSTPRITVREPCLPGPSTGIITWASGDTPSTPARLAMPLTLAATMPAVRMGTSLRSMLSSDPLPMRMTLAARPLVANAACMPLMNPDAVSTRRTTSMLPPTVSTRRPGLRPRFRTAYSKGRMRMVRRLRSSRRCCGGTDAPPVRHRRGCPGRGPGPCR